VSLPYAGGAEFNAYMRQDDALCHKGTRVALLDNIMAWALAPADASARRLFWLDSMAGTGKSTHYAHRCALLRQQEHPRRQLLHARRRRPCQRTKVHHYCRRAAGGGGASSEAAY
jgi:hypothetical protein